MKPYLQFGLGVRNDKIELRYSTSRKGTEQRRVITSVDDFEKFIKEHMKKYNLTVGDLIITCSSSMDFPEDSTNNKTTIKLAHALR